jgi:hypothetical protein
MMHYTHYFAIIWFSLPFFTFSQSTPLSDTIHKIRMPFTESSIKRYDNSLNQINIAHKNFPFITGRGKTLAIKERRFDTLDIDLKNRWFLTDFTMFNQDMHATEMATLAGGSGNTGYTGKGVAWESSITSTSFENLMPEPVSYYKSFNITVQNHSYGTGLENEYAIDAAAYDHTMWMDSTLLHVFSAGNQGQAIQTSGKYIGIQGYSNITGSFKMSKNSLTVGATDSLGRVEILSSRGPAYDGRLKPELVAFGIDGSSGAAALVSGTALLIQQILEQQLNAMPNASLVKAILIGSAKDNGTSGPDYANGYGQLNANNALQIAEKKQFFTGTASTGIESIFTINVPQNAAFLKVTLCWTDTAGVPLSALALVNDLDLEVTDETNNRWQPWVLSTFPNADSLSNRAFRGNDHLNTVEQVYIDNPAPGKYTLKIKPFSLKTTTQKFSVVYDIKQKDTLTITYPLATTPAAANDKILIRWQQTFNDNVQANIDYSFIGSSTWTPIAQNIETKRQYVAWQTPDVNELAIIRISVEGKIFYSDTFFIAKPFNVKTGFICKDTALIYWSPSAGINEYAIYTLGDTLMEQLSHTIDTLYKIPIDKLQNNWITIASKATGQAGFEARQASFNIFSQGIDCYFKSFLAQLDNGSVTLNIALGSVYNLKLLHIQKQKNGIFETIQSFNINAALDFEFLDDKVVPGANTYKAVLVLNDGREIESDIQAVVQTTKEGWWVFPNPVSRSQRLFITNRRSENVDLLVDIFDIHGRKTSTQLVPLIDNSFSVANLSAGVYFLVFTEGNKRVGYQKIVVLQ